MALLDELLDDQMADLAGAEHDVAGHDALFQARQSLRIVALDS